MFWLCLGWFLLGVVCVRAFGCDCGCWYSFRLLVVTFASFCGFFLFFGFLLFVAVFLLPCVAFLLPFCCRLLPFLLPFCSLTLPLKLICCLFLCWTFLCCACMSACSSCYNFFPPVCSPTELSARFRLWTRRCCRRMTQIAPPKVIVRMVRTDRGVGRVKRDRFIGLSICWLLVRWFLLVCLFCFCLFLCWVFVVTWFVAFALFWYVLIWTISFALFVLLHFI